MKRIALIVSVLLACVVSLGAQSQDLKRWSDGPLERSDFKGQSVLESAPSALKVSLVTDSKEVTEKHKIQYRITAEAVMDRNASSADTASMTDQRLRYHQLQFDQLELYRRRLQNDLNTGMNGIEADKKLSYYRSLYKDQIQAIRQETRDGADDKKLQEWEYYTRKALEEIGLPPAPEFAPSDWCYGLYLGVGGIFPVNEIKDYFGGCFTFTAGLTAGYKRLKLKADVSYGQVDFKKPNVFGAVDAQGRALQGPMNEYATYLGIGTTLGYSVVNTKRFAITPHVGVYWNGYSWNMANLEYVWDDNANKELAKVKSTENANMKDVSWIAGIDFDVKIHKYVTSTPFFLTGQREQFTSSIRITPYVAYAKYKVVGASGYHIGFTVSYAGIARSLRMK